MPQTLIVINKQSGSVRTMGEASVRKALEDGFGDQTAGVTIALVPGDEIDEMVDKALRDKTSRIVVGGGDGTLSRVAAKLVKTDAAMGVLPLGTMNLFSLATGTSQDLGEAILQVKSADVDQIDVGQVNDRVFLRQLSFGLQPRIVKLRERLGYRSRLSKMWNGARAFLAVVFRVRGLKVTAQVDGAPLTITTPALYISNNAFAEGMVPYQDRLDEGVVAFYAFRSSSLWPVLKMLPYILRGRWWDSDNVIALKAERVTLEYRRSRKRKARRILASIDGELEYLEMPLTIQSKPLALKVLRPVKPVLPA
jgi:diacylglycerol kinase family enzyme